MFTLRTARGRALPLGATALAGGVNFALLCRHGREVWLVFYELDGPGVLGEVALPTYGTAKFRNVKAFYIRQQLINDQVIFCGELDAVIPGTKQRSGWTKFIYIPGDPTTLMTDTPGLGTREIGPQVRKRMCEDTSQSWLSGDYTAAFNKIPAVLAEAESAD